MLFTSYTVELPPHPSHPLFYRTRTLTAPESQTPKMRNFHSTRGSGNHICTRNLRSGFRKTGFEKPFRQTFQKLRKTVLKTANNLTQITNSALINHIDALPVPVYNNINKQKKSLNILKTFVK